MNVPLMEDGRGVTDESYDASLLTSGPQGNVGWQVIDGAWKVYLEGDIDIPHGWLVVQTMAKSLMRRHVLSMLGVRRGWGTLDIGTGFGPIPMELATLAPVEAVGVDVDATVLQEADHMRVKVEGPFSSSDSCRRGARRSRGDSFLQETLTTPLPSTGPSTSPPSVLS